MLYRNEGMEDTQTESAERGLTTVSHADVHASMQNVVDRGLVIELKSVETGYQDASAVTTLLCALTARKKR